MKKFFLENKIELLLIASTVLAGYLLKSGSLILNIFGVFLLGYLFVQLMRNPELIWLSLLSSVFCGGIRSVAVFGKHPTIFYSDVIILMFLLIWLLQSIRSKKLIFFKTGFDWFFLAFIVFNFIPLVKTQFLLRGLALLRLVNMGVVIFYLFTVFNRDSSKERIDKFMWYYLFFGSIIVISLILKPVINHQTISNFMINRGAIRLSWGGPANYLAMIFNLFFPMYVGLLAYKKKPLSIISLLFIFGVYLTSSRAGILAMGFSIVLIVLKSMISIKKKIIPVLIIILIIASAFFISRNQSTSVVFERFAGFDLSKIYTGSPRHIFLKATGKALQRDPVLGLGWGNYRSFLQYYFPENWEWHDTAINIFLTQMANAGILGLTGLLLLLFMIFKMEYYLCFKQDYFNRDYEQFILIGILAFFIHTLFEDFFINYHIIIIFWTLIGAQYIKYHLARKQVK